MEKPRPWDIKQLTRFIVFIGPCSSVFDYTTYFMMLYIFNCWNVSTPEAAVHSASLFQTGWFVESLLTQTLIIHIIRTNKIPFLQSRSSGPLIGMSVVIMAIGIAIPFTATGTLSGFHGAAAALLAAAGAHAPLLRAPDAVGQDVAAAEEVDLMGEDGQRSLRSGQRPFPGARDRSRITCRVNSTAQAAHAVIARESDICGRLKNKKSLRRDAAGAPSIETGLRSRRGIDTRPHSIAIQPFD